MINTFDLYFKQPYIPVIREELEIYLNNQREMPFYQILDIYLDKKKILKRDLSKLSGLDRRDIYKIYHEKNYVPTKRTALLLGLGLRLSKAEFVSFMHDAGYHFSNYQKRDVVMMYCLDEGIYNLTKIDIYLERVGEKPLTGLK